MPITLEPTKGQNYKHKKKNAITSQLSIGAIDMNMQKTKKKRSPIKAIREFCITCMGGRGNEGHMKLVRECVSEDCELFEFRLGNNPYHTQNLTLEQRQDRSERLRTSLIHD